MKVQVRQAIASSRANETTIKNITVYCCRQKKFLPLLHETSFPERSEKSGNKRNEDSFSEVISDMNFNTGCSVCDALWNNRDGSPCNLWNIMVSLFHEAVEPFKVQLLMMKVLDFVENSIWVCWKHCHGQSCGAKSYQATCKQKILHFAENEDNETNM